MVVSICEMRKLIVEKELSKVASLEKRIDNFIRNNYQGHPLYMRIVYPGDYAFKEVKKKYESAGWKMKFEFDDEEDYLYLKEARRR